MKKAKKYLQSIQREMMLLFFSMLIFGIIWLLSGIDLQIYFYTCALLLFFATIYWTMRYIGFTEELAMKEELEELRQQKSEIENQLLEERRDMQEYFLLWLHQMKTPITAVNLLATDDTEEPERRLRTIRQEMISIENYANMAMNYLKLNNPNADLEISFVELDELIRMLLKRYGIFFIARKIRLDYEPIVFRVLSDAKWLRILIEQILNNAVKYAKGATVKIYFEKDTLYIEDTGIGIGATDLPKIFDKGYSGFNGRLNEKSTGLGLFLVREIASRLNHQIQVRSEAGKGTVFSIRFQEAKG